MKDRGLLKKSEKCRVADEIKYGKTKQGRFEQSIKTGLVYPDGRQMEISDGGRAMNRMIRSLDWAYHQARRERCIRRQAAQIRDRTLMRVLWGIFRGRNRREMIALSGLPRRTFYWGLKKLSKLYHAQ